MEIKKILEHPLVLKYRIYALPVLSIIFSLALLILVVIPQISASQKTSEEINTLNQKNTNLQKKLADLNSIDDSLYTDYLTSAKLALPVEKDISGAIGQVLYLIKSEQLTLNSIGFSTPKEENKTQSFQIRVELEGNMNNFKNFINKTASNPRILKVTSLEVSGSKRLDKVQVSLTLTTYFQDEPKALGDVEQALPIPAAKDFEYLATVKANSLLIPVINTNEIVGDKGKADPFN